MPMEPASETYEIFELTSVHTIDYDTAVGSAVISPFKDEYQDTSHHVMILMMDLIYA